LPLKMPEELSLEDAIVISGEEAMRIAMRTV